MKYNIGNQENKNNASFFTPVSGCYMGGGLLLHFLQQQKNTDLSNTE
jgi:hypothetical protein